MIEDEIASIVFATCRDIYDKVGPGLLESTYKTILTHELIKQGLTVCTEVPVTIHYEGLEIKEAYRIDMLVEDKVIIELKSVESIKEIHKAQLLTYLKLSGKKLGLLVNFNEEYLGKGFKRIVNGL